MKLSKTVKIDMEEATKIVSRYVSKKFNQKVIESDVEDDIICITLEDEDLSEKKVPEEDE